MTRFIIFTVIVLVIFAIIYNGFIARRNAVRHAFSSIDVQLKKRWNLIPNLVETVKGYADHEKAVLTAVTQARSVSSGSAERFQHEEAVTREVGRLLAVAEDHPDLKAGSHFMNLQRNLTEIESQISASRRAYNAAVTEWNQGVESFPGNLFAAAFKFERADWFEAGVGEREPRKVKFS